MNTQRFRKGLRFLRLSLFVLMMAVGGGWLGDALGEQFHVLTSGGLIEPWRIAKAVAGAGLFFLGAWCLYRNRREYLPAQILACSPGAPPARVLVLFVSPRNFDLDDGYTLVMRNGARRQLHGDAEQDCLPGGVAWNWQPLLCALRPHLTRLERIRLIGSAPVERQQGSHVELEVCAGLLKRYLPAGVTVESHPQPVDFEDMDALIETLQRVRDKAEAQGYRDRDIMIDCTGGQKTTSIASALFTTRHPRMQFQYVSTRNLQVISFNVVNEREGDLA